MAVYRLRLTLESPIATPLHSGTLFGHLCWAWRELEPEGGPTLAEWLDNLPEEPFLISDGFPAGLLPRPLLEPRLRPAPPTEPEARKEFFAKLKDRKKAPWIRVEDFLKLRNDMNDGTLAQAEIPDGAGGLCKHTSPHNRIDRLSGHTLEEGGLFFLTESWPHPEQAPVWEVYAQTSLPAGRLGDLFAHVGRTGYGRDATWGRGRFSVEVEEADPRLFDFAGNRRMSLSHGALSENMRDPRYRIACHIGRLGNLYARSDRPFKYPLMLIAPGATFEPAGDGPFGALLDRVTGFEPEPGVRIRHNAWHLTVGYRETEPN
jgi:CRISPR-associated protein Csm4